MSLCLKNLTIGIFNRLAERDLKIEANHTISGRIGQHMSRFLIGKNQKECKLRRVLYLKERPEAALKNASVIYLMKNNEIDFYAYPIDIQLSTDETSIEITKPVVFSP